MRSMVGFPLTGASGYPKISEQIREFEAHWDEEACAAWKLAVSGFLLPVLSTCSMSVGERGESWQQAENMASQVKPLAVSVSLLKIPPAASVSLGGEVSYHLLLVELSISCLSQSHLAHLMLSKTHLPLHMKEEWVHLGLLMLPC